MCASPICIFMREEMSVWTQASQIQMWMSNRSTCMQDISLSAPYIQFTPILPICCNSITMYLSTAKEQPEPIMTNVSEFSQLGVLTVYDMPIRLIMAERVTPHPLINLSTKQSQLNRSHSSHQQNSRNLILQC